MHYIFDKRTAAEAKEFHMFAQSNDGLWLIKLIKRNLFRLNL